MDSAGLTAKIKQLGRAITMESMVGTRQLYDAFHTVEPFAGVAIHRDIHYAGNERNRLDLFTPVAGSEPRPVLIYVHGGGFVAGDKWTPGTPFFDNVGVWAVRNGLIGITMTYRLAPQHRWPAGIEDMHAVVRWLRDNGTDFGIDVDRIYFIGHSAGAAHVASYLAHPDIYRPDDHGLAGVILMSGMYDLAAMEANDNIRAYYGEDAALYGPRSSIQGMTRISIPVMLVLAEHDPPDFERQTLELAAALQQRGSNPPRLVHLQGHNHLSGILHLGLPGDLLGGRLVDFIGDDTG